jgi:predicted unusual protein kinase regulating ubiquinone biosynthesis (AarF/ABC1/UbiB family)
VDELREAVFEDQVMVCDAVPGNFVRTPDGEIIAIDLPAALLVV